jgi:SpoVK/Ycf46/Vps4 family AAA+-type ATPase
LVRPPDEPARAAILRYHLRKRPVAEIEFDKLAELTDGFSGADLAQLCDSAAQRAMQDAIRLGAARPIAMPDFSAALETVKPSSGEWLQVARNVAIFANVSGAYDDLLAYLKSRRLA